MKKFLSLFAAAAALSALPLFGAAADAAKPSRAFGKADKNGDGKISEEEFVAVAGAKTDAAKAKTAFGRRDKNKDGFLTPDEFKSAETGKKEGDDASKEKPRRKNKPAN